jgi:hypothetical protein
VIKLFFSSRNPHKAIASQKPNHSSTKFDRSIQLHSTNPSIPGWKKELKMKKMSRCSAENGELILHAKN